MLILKQLFDWSYDDLEREGRANLVDRAFTRIDAGDVPDAKTIVKIARALGPDVIEPLHRQVVEVAKRAGITHGRRFRIDTTVVATNVHYPTDRTLLQDGVRVLTRALQRASAALGDEAGRIRNRLRSVTRRVLIIGYEARSPKTRGALVKSYRTLMATTRAVLRDTATMVRRLGQRVRTAGPRVHPILQRAQDQRWRVGCEGRISVLKRRHGLDRCRYHGEDGMHRWVGLGVIANNLVSTATFSGARATA